MIFLIYLIRFTNLMNVFYELDELRILQAQY